MDWVTILILVGVALLIPTAYAAKIGAPYAPTRLKVVRKAFKQFGVGSDDVLVDLGVGDGSILREAASLGAKAYGYELSPIMWAIAWLRLLRYKQAKVYYANFYKKDLTDATVIFSFLMPNNMPRVKSYLLKQALPNTRYFMSYAFPLPDDEPLTVVREDKCAPLYIYDMQALKAS